MPRIEPTGQFKRDYKREAKLQSLADDKPLEAHYRDYALCGEWKDHRDCHIKFDLVLNLSEALRRSLAIGADRVAQRTWLVSQRIFNASCSPFERIARKQ
jgi:mRNA interferase YafQ